MAAYVGQRASGAVNNGSGTTQQLTLSSSCSAGNTVILIFACRDTSIAGISVADSKSNSWSIDAGPLNTNNDLVLIASTRQNTGTLLSGDTITVTFGTAPNAARGWLVQEVSGLVTSSYVDRTQSNNSPTTVLNPSTGTTAVTTQANEFAVSAFCMGVNVSGEESQSFTADPGWSQWTTTRVAIPDGTNGGLSKFLISQYDILTSTGAQSSSITLTTAESYQALIVTYKASTGTLDPGRTQDVRITGVAAPENNTFGSGSFGVLVFGFTGAQDSFTWNARITGRDTRNVTYTTRLTSRDTNSTTFDVRIRGGAQSSLTVFESRVTGRNTSQAAFDARLTSGVLSFSTQDARQTGRNTSNITYSARLTAQAANSVTYDARQIGRNTSQTALDARLTTVGDTSAAYDARLTGTASSSVAYTSAITAQAVSNRTQDIRLTGQLSSSVTRDIRTTAQLSSNVTYAARETGSATSNVGYEARLTSRASTSAVYNTRITGQSAASEIAYDVATSAQAQNAISFITCITGIIAPQVAVPVADNLVGTWHDTPLWSKINDDDGDFMESGSSPIVVDVCEVQLGPLNDPLSSSAHIVRYKYAKNAGSGDRIDLVVRLMQNGVQIAAWSHADIDAITDAEHTLTGTEADSITDYGDLQLRFEAIKV